MEHIISCGGHLHQRYQCVNCSHHLLHLVELLGKPVTQLPMDHLMHGQRMHRYAARQSHAHIHTTHQTFRAQMQQGQGHVGLAVQWGNWDGGGMAVNNKGFIERMKRIGLGMSKPSYHFKEDTC